jgi:hypothetical protein
MLLRMDGGKAEGNTEPNGDWEIEPATDDGVVGPVGVPGIACIPFESNGLDGIWTRRSEERFSKGDVGLLAGLKDPGHGGGGGLLVVATMLDGISVIGVSTEATVPSKEGAEEPPLFGLSAISTEFA